MKTLLILRHAKTQPDAPNGDRARELTDRGHRNAEAMANYIQTTFGVPDAIITSDAKRAQQTAEIVASVFADPTPLTVEPRIYDADVNTLVALVRSILNDVNSAMIVGHNPGFEDLTDALVGETEEPVRLPTSGLAVVEFEVDTWDAVRKWSGRLREVATPRSIQEPIAE